MKLTADQMKLVSSTVRCLCADIVDKAKSGPPGGPMGQADLAVSLWLKYLNIDPTDPKWPGRDRMVFSGGHTSALVYSLSHLAGADFDETAGYVFFSFEFVGLLVAAGCLGRLLVASGYTRLGPAMGKFALGYILFANAMSIVAEAADGFSRKDAQVLPCNIDGLSKILSAHYLIATAIAAVALVLLVLATVMDFSKFRKP